MRLRGKLRRLAMWSAGVGGMLLLLPVAFVCVENWRGERAWHEYVREQAMQGAPSDWLPPPSVLPAERNFMKTPLLDGLLFAARDTPERKDFEERTRLWSGVRLFEFGWRQGKSFDPERMLAVLAETREEQGLPLRTSAGSPVDRLAAELCEFDPLFEVLAAAAASCPESELVRPSRISPDPEVKQVTAAFSITRRLFQLLATKACNDLAGGRAEEACRAVCAGLALVRGFFDMPDAMITESMTGMVGTGMLLQPVWEGCRSGAWNDAQLARLSSELERLKPLESLGRAYRFEGVRAMATAELLKRTGKCYDWGAIGSLYTAFGERTLPWWFAGYRWVPGWTLQNSVRLAAGYAEIERVLGRRETAGFLPALSEMEAQHQAIETAPGPYEFVAGIGLAAPGTVLRHGLQTENELCMARVVCGIARFRSAHGRLPDSLAEIAGDSGGGFAVDLIDGQRLRYRCDKSGVGFRLYSVGLDGNDDGGDAAADYIRGEAMPSGDWCWPQLVH